MTAPRELVALSDICLVTNVDHRTCNTCGEIHPYLSIKDAEGDCGTPAVFPRSMVEDKFGPPLGGKVVALKANV